MKRLLVLWAALSLTAGGQVHAAATDPATMQSCTQQARAQVQQEDPNDELSDDTHQLDLKLFTANCLVKAHQDADAATLYREIVKYIDVADPSDSDREAEALWRLATIEERSGQRAQAIADIQRAHSLDARFGTVADAKPDFMKDYRRLNASQIRVQDSIALREVRKQNAISLRENRAYWHTLSSDERSVIWNHGGSRDYNKDARPCHVESFSARAYVEKTWWYCGEGGRYAEAFTFLNGRLKSTYKP